MLEARSMAALLQWAAAVQPLRVDSRKKNLRIFKNVWKLVRFFQIKQKNCKKKKNYVLPVLMERDLMACVLFVVRLLVVHDWFT